MKKVSKPAHGPWVLQRTYKKRLEALKAEKSRADGLKFYANNLEVALKNFHEMHNRHNRCDCGHCMYARRLLNLPWPGLSIKEILEEEVKKADRWKL